MKLLSTTFIFYLSTYSIFGQAAPKISPDSIAKHVYYLASDELQGRNTGSPGQKLAADYIANYFRAFGLKPAGNSESNPYFQEFFLYSHNVYHKFPVYKDLNADKYGNSREEFLYFGTKTRTEIWLDETICTFPQKCCGDTAVYRFFRTNDLKALTDSVRFIYETCNNRKFIALLPDDVFRGVEQGKPGWNSMLYKINGEYKFLPSGKQGESSDNKEYMLVNNFVSEMSNVELILISQGFLIERGYLPDAAARLDSAQFKIFKAQIHDSILTENVAGYIESPRKSNRCIVIGAHYDHIGFNNKGIYNGADDNASGTAALIELARLFSQPAVRNSLNTNILIIAFSAEEKGLLGSQLYTVFPYFPLDSTIVMLNMDMIGRLKLKPNGKGQVLFLSFGNEKKQLNKTVRKAAASKKFIRVYPHPGLINRIGYKRGSDHYNFFTNGVTSGVFFTGLHEDYHKTTDTAEKISYRNMAEIIRLVYLTALKYDMKQ
jgi:hypothetical protein